MMEGNGNPVLWTIFLVGHLPVISRSSVGGIAEEPFGEVDNLYALVVVLRMTGADDDELGIAMSFISKTIIIFDF